MTKWLLGRTRARSCYPQDNPEPSWNCRWFWSHPLFRDTKLRNDIKTIQTSEIYYQYILCHWSVASGIAYSILQLRLNVIFLKKHHLFLNNWGSNQYQHQLQTQSRSLFGTFCNRAEDDWTKPQVYTLTIADHLDNPSESRRRRVPSGACLVTTCLLLSGWKNHIIYIIYTIIQYVYVCIIIYTVLYCIYTVTTSISNYSIHQYSCYSCCYGFWSLRKTLCSSKGTGSKQTQPYHSSLPLPGVGVERLYPLTRSR